MTVESTALDRAERRPDWAAWIIVGLCFLTLAVSFSARSSLSLIMDGLNKELGWTPSQTSFAISLAQIVMAIVSPIVGNMVDRFGPRLLLSAGLVAIGGGMLLASGATALWQLYAAYGIVAGIGFGTAATHLVATIVSLRFSRQRGLAVGIATAGATGGQLVVIPVLARVLDSTGWRMSYIAIGAAVLVLVPVILAATRGDVRAGGQTRRAAVAEPLGERIVFLLRQPTFHLLFWSYFICGITTSGVIEAHLIPYAVYCGFPVTESSDAFGLLMAVNMGGMMLAGWLTDRMNRPLLLGGIYVIRGLSFIVLMFIAGDYPLLIAFAVLFGVMDYSTVPVTASLAASHLGLRLLGLSMGLLTAGHALGAAVGAQMGGTLFDLYASYRWVWIVALATALLAGVLSFSIRETRGTGGLVPAAA